MTNRARERKACELYQASMGIQTLGPTMIYQLFPALNRGECQCQRQLKLKSWTSARFSLMLFVSKYLIINVLMLGLRSQVDELLDDLDYAIDDGKNILRRTRRLISLEASSLSRGLERA